MEIERKFLISQIPIDLSHCSFHQIEQGYLATAPVIRIRRADNDYYLTYKSVGFLAREEYNLPLTAEAYHHLRSKIDGILIKKKRYLIPYKGFTIELDVFAEALAPLVLAEVEFKTEQEAKRFSPPDWFGQDVTFLPDYQNNTLSQKGLTP